jgi:hypothetical protein
MILSTHGVIASQIQSFVGLLDTYPNAAAAYSLRKLRAAYTGSAIRVRRSSDNTEQDIGFTALGNLDESALTSFCSGTNGFVTTWYDQSGNGRNATQTTGLFQPQIVSSGSLILENSKPSLQFDGSVNRLSVGNFDLYSNTNGQSIASVFRSLNSNTNTQIGSYLTPIFLLAVPILDTTVAVISRLRRHRSPFQGGQDHLSHRLIRAGLSRKQAAISLWLLSGVYGALAILISKANSIYENYLVLAGTALWVVLFTLFFKQKDA